MGEWGGGGGGFGGGMKKYEKQFNNNNDADDKINYAQGWRVRKKGKEASAAVAHLIRFPDTGGYQVPFDKQTQ